MEKDEEVANFMLSLLSSFSWITLRDSTLDIVTTPLGHTVISVLPLCKVEWGRTNVQIHMLEDKRTILFTKPRIALHDCILSVILEAASSYQLSYEYLGDTYGVSLPLKPKSGDWPKGLSYVQLHHLQKKCMATYPTKLYFVPLSSSASLIVIEDESDCIYHDNGVFTVVKCPGGNAEEKFVFTPWTHRLELRQRSAVLGSHTYIFEKFIGGGTYGKVYTASLMSTSRKEQIIAVKVIKLISDKVAQLVDKEIEALKILKHPHIVEFYGYSFINDEIEAHLGLEYIQGSDLLEYFNKYHKGGMNEALARKIFRQLLNAVLYIHSKGYIHCDLKLENILIDSEDRIKVTDFGFATPYSSNKKMVYSKGSRNYASPEVVLKRSFYGPETDVWSMGVVLFCLTCGVMPVVFGNKPAHCAYENIEKTGLEFRKDGLSDALKDLLLRMIEVKSSQRITLEEVEKHCWILDKPLHSTTLNLEKVFTIPHIIRSPGKFISPGVSPLTSPISSPRLTPNSSPHRSPRDELPSPPSRGGHRASLSPIAPLSTNTAAPTTSNSSKVLQRKTSLRQLTQLKDDLLRTALKVNSSKTPPNPIGSASPRGDHIQNIKRSTSS